MNIDITTGTYNSWGSAPVACFVGSFLAKGAPPDLGTAIETIEITARSRSVDALPHPSLANMRARFDESFGQPTKVTFKRKRRKVEIVYDCARWTYEELHQFTANKPGLAAFSVLCEDIAAATEAVSKKLTKKDDFRIDLLRTHFATRLSQRPTTEPELVALLDELSQEEIERRAERANNVEKREVVAKGRPALIPINHDDYHACDIGRLADGRQFFFTQPFVPGEREFLALYIFDKKGALLEAVIHDLGRRQDVDGAEVERLSKSLLESLGIFSRQRIKIAPFELERFGTTFGLIAREPEDDEGWWFTFEPGDVMAFHRPWNGEYDT